MATAARMAISKQYIKLSEKHHKNLMGLKKLLTRESIYIRKGSHTVVVLRPEFKYEFNLTDLILSGVREINRLDKALDCAEVILEHMQEINEKYDYVPEILMPSNKLLKCKIKYGKSSEAIVKVCLMHSEVAVNTVSTFNKNGPSTCIFNMKLHNPDSIKKAFDAVHGLIENSMTNFKDELRAVLKSDDKNLFERMRGYGWFW